ncbi:DUF1904 family protein [Paenibacillus sp. 481]|uniref:DUF1904 family protein n=1 Tax=Paenibacillus sp. 481 TaxID=2835869 RepID=UPI001E60E017|nr:DUF1904 family protein [Paenibacillus sp. 481]UHA75031.1 DUF1904 family protein [Paenibacillus sp. 481]
MPHLLVRGVKPEQLARVSQPLVDELAAICQCGTDNFTIECLQTVGVFAGEVVPSFPFVEVAWFERGDNARDQFAQAVTKHIQALGITEIEVAFTTYSADQYYIEGKRCDRL